MKLFCSAVRCHSCRILPLDKLICHFFLLLFAGSGKKLDGIFSVNSCAHSHMGVHCVCASQSVSLCLCGISWECQAIHSHTRTHRQLFFVFYIDLIVCSLALWSRVYLILDLRSPCNLHAWFVFFLPSSSLSRIIDYVFDWFLKPTPLPFLPFQIGNISREFSRCHCVRECDRACICMVNNAILSKSSRRLTDKFIHFSVVSIICPPTH